MFISSRRPNEMTISFILLHARVVLNSPVILNVLTVWLNFEPEIQAAHNVPAFSWYCGKVWSWGLPSKSPCTSGHNVSTGRITWSVFTFHDGAPVAQWVCSINCSCLFLKSVNVIWVLWTCVRVPSLEHFLNCILSPFTKRIGVTPSAPRKDHENYFAVDHENYSAVAVE